MKQSYSQWLKDREYSEATQSAQIHRVKKIEKTYGDLDDVFLKGSYEELVDTLRYTAKDKLDNKPNPSKITFKTDVDLQSNLQSYRDAALRYKKFLMEEVKGSDSVVSEALQISKEAIQQSFSLERDMQAALRNNIQSLGNGITIIDEGAERAVESGFIDITCKDQQGIIVVELKAGKADSRAIAQILGYMGDIQQEEGGQVRGILVASDFDKRVKSAARMVPGLQLKKYSIQFLFSSDI